MQHTKTSTLQAAKILFLSLGLGLTLIACGGGGGGGGNSGPAGISYTGNTNESDVNDANTQTYSAAILDGSQDSQENYNALAGGVISTTGETVQKNKQHAMLNTLVEQVKSSIESSPSTTGAVATGFIIPTAAGDCGGSSSVSSGNTSYEISYNAYCSSLPGGGTVTMSGSITASVTIVDNQISEMNISFSRFTMVFVDSSDATYTNEFSGSIAVNLTATGDIDNMTITVNFVENGKVYQLANMNYVTAGAEISISGTIYHPDHGHVSFTTTNPFVLYNDQLCDGILYVTGANDSNFTLTVDQTCQSYTYTGTNSLGDPISGTF